MLVDEWQAEFAAELARGAAARSDGNEGRARVCARRAVGILLREYLRRNEPRLGHPDGNALDLIERASQFPELAAAQKEVLSHFTTRVIPGGSLPIQVDLLADARWLKTELLTTKSGEDHRNINPRNRDHIT